MRDVREQDLEKELERRFETIKMKNDEIERLKGNQRSSNNEKLGSGYGKNGNEFVSNLARQLLSNLDGMLKRGNVSPAQLEG